jgi:hypothetical protein
MQGALYIRSPIDRKKTPAFGGEVIDVQVVMGIEEFCGEENLHELEGLVMSRHFCNF